MKVSIIVGSKSDVDYADKCSEILKSLSVEHSIKVLSAHRTPKLLSEHIEKCEKDGVSVFIAMAGLAAHLAGSVAAKTFKPVIGVPIDSGSLNGIDALLATVQMPKGVPVATVAIGSAGASNAAYLAAQILSLSSKSISDSLRDVREQNIKSIKELNKNLK